MLLSTDMNVAQSPDDKLLRFTCITCGVRLVVDQALAGTEGPCPSCGVKITAPSLASSQDHVDEVAVTAVEDKEKGNEVAALDLADSSPPAEQSLISIEEDITEELEVKQSSGILFKLICAILLILLIAGNVYLYLKSN